MKLKITLFLLIFLTFNLSAQLTGNKYIPGDYTSIGEAIDSLNLYGVGFGGVTFNIQAGYVESDSIPPITSTGTASNPIIFQKDGVGNNPLIEFNNTANNSSVISPFRLIGADFITFQELSFESLLVHTGGSNHAIEMDGGFSSNDGCQNNTIQECEFINTGILLATSFYATGANGVFLSNEILNNEVHIYSPSTQQSIIALINEYGSLLDQNTKIIGNTINYLAPASPSIISFHMRSQDNFVCKFNSFNYLDIQQSQHLTGLLLTNGLANPATANKFEIENNAFNFENISLNNSNSKIKGIELIFSGITYDSLIIRDNHFTGVDLNVPFFRSIYLNSSATTSSIHDNTFSINSSEGGLFQGVGTSGTNNEILISENQFINLTDNDVDNLQLIALGVLHSDGSPYPPSTLPPSTNNGSIKIMGNLMNNIENSSNTGGVTGVYVNGIQGTLIDNNTFSGFTSGNDIYAIKGEYFINSETIQNNQFHDFTASGNIHAIHNVSHTENSTISNNQIFNFNALGSSTGFSFDNQNSSGIRNILENEIYNLTSDSAVVALRVGGGENVVNDNHFYALEVVEPTSTGGLSGILFGTGDITLTNNTIQNFNHQGTGNLYGIQGTDTTSLESIENNQIYDLTSSNGSVYGLFSKSISELRTIKTNEIYNLSAYNSVIGAAFENSNTHFHRNKIYGLESGSNIGKATGIQFDYGDSVFVSNNLIGNLSAPNSNNLNGVNGILIDTLGFANIYYNSMVLSAENLSNDFGSSSIFIGKASENIDLRNNIFINTSQSNGSGLTVGLRMENDDLSVLSPDNDNNLYFVDTLISNTAIYYDGTNTDVSLLAFQQRMDTREQNSFTQDVSFQSLNGSSIDFLRPDNAISTFVESNAQEISGYEDDYHFLSIRTGYPQTGQTNGGGEQPDIGAIEGDYIPAISSVGEEDLDDVEVTLFPNPVIDILEVKVNNNDQKPYEISIMNVNGKLIESRSTDKKNAKINFQNLESGVYFVRISFETKEIIEKIIAY